MACKFCCLVLNDLLPSCLRLTRSHSPSPRRSRNSSPVRSESPTRAQLTSSSRHARLVSRFSDLYAIERLEAQSLLCRYIDDLETVQRIIFIAAVVRSKHFCCMLALCQFYAFVQLCTFFMLRFLLLFRFNDKDLSIIM